MLPIPAQGEWFPDVRAGDRALRVSWHLEVGCVVLSTWREGGCVATSRLTPAEVARLIAVLGDGLAAAASSTTGPDMITTVGSG